MKEGLCKVWSSRVLAGLLLSGGVRGRMGSWRCRGFEERAWLAGKEPEERDVDKMCVL